MQCWCTNLSDFKWNSNITCEKCLLKVWKYAVLVDSGDIKIWPHAAYRCRQSFHISLIYVSFSVPWYMKVTIDHCITSVSITYLLQTLHPAQISVIVTCGQVQSVWRSMWPHGTVREGSVECDWRRTVVLAVCICCQELDSPIMMLLLTLPLQYFLYQGKALVFLIMDKVGDVWLIAMTGMIQMPWGSWDLLSVSLPSHSTTPALTQRWVINCSVFWDRG